MTFKFGGGGDSSGALTKSSFSAANAISAGDPVLIDGSGKVLKQTASGCLLYTSPRQRDS